MLSSPGGLLQRHGFTSLLNTRDELARELASVERQWMEVRRRIPLWDRVVFFHDTQDEALAGQLRARMGALRDRHDAARRELDATAARLFAEAPPIEIAYRVEQVIAAARADLTVARRDGTRDRLASELEDIAARVVDLWVPGFDSVQLGRLLANAQARQKAAARTPGPLREDPALGFAPITPDELASRAARALVSEAFVQAQSAVAKEASDHQRVAEQLETARSQVSMLEHLTPGSSQAERAVSTLEETLKAEYGQYVAAVETFHLLIERAIAVFPPMGIHFAALASAGAIRTADPVPEPALADTGELGVRPGFAARAVLLATLIQLRAALDEAFPGLGNLVSTREARHNASHDAGPYRGAPPSEAERAAAKVVSPDDPLLDELEARGLRAVVIRGTSHASMLGSVARARSGVSRKIGWSDRLAVWSDSEDKLTESQLNEREMWHQTMFHWVCRQGTQIVDQASRSSARHALGAAVLATHQAWLGIKTREGSSSSPIVCPERGKKEMIQALGAAQGCLQSFGLRGERHHLVGAIVEHLRGRPVPSPVQPGTPAKVLSSEQVVAAVAEVLRPMGFLQLQQSLMARRTEYAAAAHEAQRARNAVSLLDKINVFTDTPAEKRRDDLDLRTQKLFQEMRAQEHQANALLDRALWIYPPAVVYYGIFHVLAAASAIHAVRHTGTSSTTVGKSTVRRTYYYCRLHGKEEAGRALRYWTRNITACFGVIPSPSELMAQWVARELE